MYRYSSTNIFLLFLAISFYNSIGLKAGIFEGYRLNIRYVQNKDVLICTDLEMAKKLILLVEGKFVRNDELKKLVSDLMSDGDCSVYENADFIPIKTLYRPKVKSYTTKENGVIQQRTYATNLLEIQPLGDDSGKSYYFITHAKVPPLPPGTRSVLEGMDTSFLNKLKKKKK